jgi:tRNA nucleotidyltransferase (CCA-adding enzyme)
MNYSLPEELIEKIVGRGILYEVGGTVRDQLIDPDTEHKDRDYLVTGIPIDDLSSILRRFGRVDVVGKSFGVIKFTARGTGETADFAIPRTERSTGAAHRDFEVEFDPDLPVEVDLKRRDFTINALAREIPSQEIVDPYGGRADIDKKIIRMVFPEAIIEDPLRILRGAQFAARLGFRIESETLKSMEKNIETIETVAPERIAEEINKMLLKAEKPSIGFQYLLEMGALEKIFPELVDCVGVDQPGGYHRWDVFDHTMICVDNSPKKLSIRLAALFHDVGKPATIELTDNGATFYGHDKLSAKMAAKALKRLKYANDIIDDVTKLVSKHMFSEGAGDKGVRRLVRSVGQDLIFDLLSLRRADTLSQGMGQDLSGISEFEQKVASEIEKKPPFGFSDLAVNGTDLMREFDLPESPLIGDILNDLLEMVLDNPDLNTKEELLRRAKGYLSQKRS